MKNDGTLIRVDLDLKNAFNSAGHSCLWTILEGFGVPDVWLLKNIYEKSSMRVQVGGEYTAAIQLDTGTIQGSVLEQACKRSVPCEVSKWKWTRYNMVRTRL